MNTFIYLLLLITLVKGYYVDVLVFDLHPWFIFVIVVIIRFLFNI